MNNKYFRYILLACLIGGGIFGIGLTFMLIGHVPADQPLYFLFILLFAIMFIIGIFIGWKLIKKSEKALNWAKIYFAIQIPLIESPALCYYFHTGLGFTITTTANAILNFGSAINLVFSDPTKPWVFGINIVALLIFLKLRKIKSVVELYPVKQA